MIKLYRTADNKLADEVEETLQEMVMAHRIDVVSSLEELSFDVNGHSLPLLVDGDEVVSGEKALYKHLEKQRRLLEDWYRFQADACETDRDGKVC